jgi:hypothetical protein
MSLTRPIAFWIAVFAAVIAAVVLLREILLPFVAGMVLAYLLDPLATRLERFGMNRLIATLRANPRQFGAFRTPSGNLRYRETAWWSERDSNSRYGTPVWLRRMSHPRGGPT